MGRSEQAIGFVFALTGSLIVAMFVVSGNESILQGAANSLFGNWIQDSNFRFYLLDALIVVSFVIFGWFAIRGVKGNALGAVEG